jgi:hypothetical protein
VGVRFVVAVVWGLELVGRTGGSPVPVLESEVGVVDEDGDLLVGDLVVVVGVVLGALVDVVVVAALDVTGTGVVVGGITVTEDATPVP